MMDDDLSPISSSTSSGGSGYDERKHSSMSRFGNHGIMGVYPEEV